MAEYMIVPSPRLLVPLGTLDPVKAAPLSDAALNRYFATEAATRATRLTLLGDVAEVWLTYGADASRLKIAQDTVVSAESSVRLTRARLKGGIAPRTAPASHETPASIQPIGYSANVKIERNTTASTAALGIRRFMTSPTATQISTPDRIAARTV